jgi:hypothetical protein
MGEVWNIAVHLHWISIIILFLLCIRLLISPFVALFHFLARHWGGESGAGFSRDLLIGVDIS